MNGKFCCIATLLCASFCTTLPAASNALKVGVLAFGTLNWELRIAERHGLAARADLAVEARILASTEAAKVALLAGSVDVIVSDWVWVADQRRRGRSLRFRPYSNLAGALLVAANSRIRSVADLHGARLGVAGGANDKNWLWLQALTQRTNGFDIAKSADVVFAAPPLLNEQLRLGRVDAVLTYWHLAARLEAQGYRSVLTGADMLRSLGASDGLPSLGYVYREDWANANPSAIEAFFQAMHEARDLACRDPLQGAELDAAMLEPDAKVRGSLRRSYCAAQTPTLGAESTRDAEALYRVLGEISGGTVGGKLPDGVFVAPAADSKAP